MIMAALPAEVSAVVNAAVRLFAAAPAFLIFLASFAVYLIV
jgi:hypothetical protein